MKLLFLFAFISIALFSCKKDSTTIADDGISGVQQTTTAPSISERGYLNFKNTKDVVAFSKGLMLSDNPNAIMLPFLEKGFKKRSNNSSIYARDPNSIYSLIFNEEGLLQVDNVIMKITDDDKFLYTLKEQYADQETFNKLLDEIFDGLRMNKINVDRNLMEEFNLIDFTAENPFGQLEELYGSTEKRPMFGSSQTTTTVTDPGFYNVYGQCQVCTHSYQTTTTYIFWIGFPGDPVYQSTTCVAANTCR